jgi:hypothetical protein
MRINRIPTLLSLVIAALAFLSAAGAAQMPTSIVAPPKDASKQVSKPIAKTNPGPDTKPSSGSAHKAEAPLLPSSFAGWETTSPAKSISDPAQADPIAVAALKEYGFSDGLLADYSREGDSLKIKALRFEDASGAYGAYTFYRQNGWPREEVGTGAASDNNRVLFWMGNVFIDCQFSHVSAMTGSELRELASQIPVPAGNKSLPPPILGNLPQKNPPTNPDGPDPQTTHYALGSAGYAGSGGVLPPSLVGFDRGAEAVTANYKLRSGPATLTIINYPTPQMAAAQEQAIAAYLKAGNSPQHPFTKPLQDSNPTAIEVRRSGPLVAVVSGDPIQDEAHKLLDRVHFEAETSPLPGNGSNDIQKTAQLLVAIITLVVVMFAAALFLALFLGGGRALYRFLRGRPISSVYDEEFIKLDLSE